MQTREQVLILVEGHQIVKSKQKLDICEFQWNFKDNAEKQKFKNNLIFLHTEFLGSQINAELEGRAHQALNSGKIKGMEGKQKKTKLFLKPCFKDTLF